MSKIDLKELDKAATQGTWGQFNADTGPFQSQAGAFLDNRRDEYWANHDTSHHMSTLVDGNPKRLAEFTHAADAAFAEALVNAYRAGELVAAEWNHDMSKAPRDGTHVDLWTKSEKSGATMRLTECWYCDQSDTWYWFHGHAQLLPENYQPIAWKRITTPEVG